MHRSTVLGLLGYLGRGTWLLASGLIVLAMLLPIEPAQRLQMVLVVGVTAAYWHGLLRWFIPRYIGRRFFSELVVTGNVLIVTLAVAALEPLGLAGFESFYFLLVALAAGLGGRRPALWAAGESSACLLWLRATNGLLAAPAGWLNFASGAAVLAATAVMLSAVVDGLRRDWREAANRSAALLALERRRTTQLVTLQELSTRLSAGLDLEGVCQALYEGLGELMPTDAFSICLVDEAAGTRSHIFNVDGGVRMPPMTLPLDGGVTSHVVRTRQAVLIKDAKDETRFEIIRWGNGRPVVSSLSAPMVLKDRVTGVVSTQGYRPEAFDEDHLRALTQFAAHAAIAIENARLYQSERRRADELVALRATAMDLSTELELPRLLGTILERAMTLIACTGGEISLLNSAQACLEVVASQNLGKDFAGTRIEIGEGVAGRVVETGEPVVVEDYAHWPARMNVYDGEMVSAVMGVPLISRGQLLGVIALVDSHLERRFSPSDLALLILFSGQAATAVANARQYEAEYRRAEQQKALLEVARIVASTLDLGEALQRIGKQIQQVVPGDTFFVSLTRDDEQTIEFLVDDGQYFPRQEVPLGYGLARWVLEHRRSLRLGNVPEALPRLGLTTLVVGRNRPSLSWMGVPLLAGGDCLGLIAAGSYRPDVYTESDEEVMRQIAAHAALVIANVSIHAEVQRQARSDSLTGVYNHGYFLHCLAEALEAAEREGGNLSVIMLDVDHFKQYNDTYGHMAGDEVLRLTVHAIRVHIKRTDLVGRWGGEEFAIGLLGATAEQGLEVARRVQSTLAGMTLDLRGVSLPMPTVSQGVAAFPEDARDWASLVNVADHALYRAKSLGRNQIRAASAGGPGPG